MDRTDGPRIQYSRGDLSPFIQAIHHTEKKKKKTKRRDETKWGEKEIGEGEREGDRGAQVSVTSC